jgi:hypothetical protein
MSGTPSGEPHPLCIVQYLDLRERTLADGSRELELFMRGDDGPVALNEELAVKLRDFLDGWLLDQKTRRQRHETMRMIEKAQEEERRRREEPDG